MQNMALEEVRKKVGEKVLFKLFVFILFILFIYLFRQLKNNTEQRIVLKLIIITV